MNLEPIAQFLESEGLATQGVDLFVQFAPANAGECVLLRDDPAGTPLDHELPRYLKGAFQLIVRSRTYLEGSTLARRMARALTIGEVRLTGMFVRRIRPRHDPVAFPSSDGKVIETSVNFDAVYVDLREDSSFT